MKVGQKILAAEKNIFHVQQSYQNISFYVFFSAVSKAMWNVHKTAGRVNNQAKENGTIKQ